VDDTKADATFALMLAGGAAPPPLPRLGTPEYIVAADGGLALAGDIGVRPDVVIGDLDSVDPTLLAEAQNSGTRVDRHPPDKDATDWELALGHVAARGFGHLVILGGAGGRFDHLLANALTLANDDYAGMTIVWYVGAATVRVARPGTPVTVRGAPGDTVSLLAAGAPADGVTTAGLRWTLVGDTLSSTSSRGISNELVTETASVSLTAGAVLVLHEASAP
jgi:thiamine pyrophosphokinase